MMIRPSHHVLMPMRMVLCIVMIVMTMILIPIQGTPIWIDRGLYVGFDQDGYGADLTLTCCLEIEMQDSANVIGGASVELVLAIGGRGFQRRRFIPDLLLTDENRFRSPSFQAIGIWRLFYCTRPRWRGDVR